MWQYVEIIQLVQHLSNDFANGQRSMKPGIYGSKDAGNLP
jgi:hypothetical protein